MSKRGQVTLFVIIAIVIVVLVVLFFVLRNTIFKTTSENTQEKVRAFVQDNLKDSSENAILLVGSQGGYVNTPEPYYVRGDFKIAYWYYNFSSFYPSLQDIKDEISKVVSSYTPSCEEIKKISEEASCSSINVTTEIDQEKISVFLNYPITIKENEQSISLKPDYEYDVDLRFLDLYNSALEVYNNSSCLNCLEFLATSNDLYINKIEENNALLFTLEQRDARISDIEGYMFIFAMQK